METNDKARAWYKEDQYKILVDALIDKELLDDVEIARLAQDLKSQFPARSVKALELILARIHILIHGQAPYGFGADLLLRDLPSQEIIQYVEQVTGRSASTNIERSKKVPTARRNEQDARELLAGQFLILKNRLTPEQAERLRANRKEIIVLLQKGYTPQAAFEQFI